MPNDYYNLLDIKAFQDTKADGAMYETLFKQGGIGGRPMCDPFTSCSMGGDIIPNRNDVSMGTCPSKNIQNCIQNNTISADNGQGNTLVNKQTMNCVQNVVNSEKPKVNPTDVESGNGSKPGAVGSKPGAVGSQPGAVGSQLASISNGNIAIIAVIAVIVIIIIIVYFATKK